MYMIFCIDLITTQCFIFEAVFCCNYVSFLIITKKFKEVSKNIKTFGILVLNNLLLDNVSKIQFYNRKRERNERGSITWVVHKLSHVIYDHGTMTFVTVDLPHSPRINRNMDIVSARELTFIVSGISLALVTAVIILVVIEEGGVTYQYKCLIFF